MGLNSFLRQPFPLAVLKSFISALVGGFFFHLGQWIIAMSYRTPAGAPYASEDDKAIQAAACDVIADLKRLTAEGEPIDYTTVIKLSHGYEVEIHATAIHEEEGGKESKCKEVETLPYKVAVAG